MEALLAINSPGFTSYKFRKPDVLVAMKFELYCFTGIYQILFVCMWNYDR